MAHSALRIKEKLCNTPHLISPTSFETIVSYLENKNFADDGGKDEDHKKKRGTYNTDTNVGFIDIQGPLTYKLTGLEMLCGGCSYEGILEQFHEMVDAGIKTIVLNEDSGGGAAYGMMETSRQLREMADKNGIKLIAYVDGMSASAAYGLAVSAHEIIANPDSEVGSIGVVVRLQNDAKALEQKGIERTFVYAGDNKVPFAEDGSFRKEFLADIQMKVDALYEQFTGFVAEMRSIPVQAVKDTQAAVFMSNDALKLGLVDKVMTREEFFTYLSSEAEKQSKGGGMLHKFFNMSKEKENAEMAQLEALQAQMAELQESLVAKSAEFETKVAELTANYEEQINAVKADLSKAVEDKAKAEAKMAEIAQAAVDKKLADRKGSLQAAVGDVEAEELMAIAAGMEDKGFEVLLKSVSAAVTKQAEGEMFVEMGVGGKAEPTVKHFADYLPKKK